MDIDLGERRYRIRAEQRGDTWIAQAESEGGGRYGPEITGVTEREAIDRFAAWLGWQEEHARALDALQQAERAYHRAIAGSAFAGAAEEPAAGDVQQELLEGVDAARRALDLVRARKPL